MPIPKPIATPALALVANATPANSTTATNMFLVFMIVIPSNFSFGSHARRPPSFSIVSLARPTANGNYALESRQGVGTGFGGLRAG